MLATDGGSSFFSPATNVQIDAPVQTQTNVDPTTITESVSKSANAFSARWAP